MDNSLEQLHAAYTTRPEEIAAVVARTTTNPITSQAKIVGGFDNEVHAVTTTNGAKLVVHVRCHGELPFDDIVWAIGQARAAGAPVPDVLLCDRAWIDGAEREVMVQRALPGRSLKELIPTLDDDQLRACCLQWAAMLTTLHSVPVDGFGMRRNGVWDFPDWEYMTSRLRPGSTERMTLLRSGLLEDEVTRMSVALDRLRRRFPCPQPVLLHGDFTPGHLLFDDALMLIGILDFGQFQGGSPIVDFDLILPDLLETGESAWYKWLRTEYLQDGYGPTSIWDGFAEHRLLYAINEYVTYVSYHTLIGDTTTVARLVPRVRALLALLDAYL